MSKNVIIDGQVLTGVTVIKAKDVNTEEYDEFVDTSDATAESDDIARSKTAYVGGQKVTGTGFIGDGNYNIEQVISGNACSLNITTAGEVPQPKETTVTLNFGNNDQQIVTPEAGKSFSKVTIEKPETLVPENIMLGTNIAGVVGTSVGNGVPADIIDGTLTEFTMPSSKSVIAPYRFYNFTSLVNVNLGNTTTVNNYAFRGCSNAVVTLPSTLVNIGSYGMYQLGANKTPFTFEPANTCTVGDYALASSKVSTVVGDFTRIGNNAFEDCNSLTTIAVTGTNSAIGNYAFRNSTSVTSISLDGFTGTIGTYTFYGLNRVSTLDLNNAVITTLGDYAFSRVGYSRSTPASNRFVLDLRKSTFATIPQYAFGSDSSSYNLRYADIYIPTKVSTINNYAFRYIDNVDIFFSSTTPPTLSGTSVFTNATNYNLFVPFGSVNTYRTASNWTTLTLKGYMSAGTLPVGAQLPTMNSEGYACTWYSDRALTNPISIVESEDDVYYCSLGTEKIGFGITSVFTDGCSITILGNDGHTYVEGEGVLTDTVLTITATPSDPSWIPFMFTVNGQAFTSGDTVTVAEDISITAIYYNGTDIPVNPTFDMNSWVIIRNVFRAGTAGSYWEPGDTKTITMDGNDYTIRIADMKTGRYELTDGSGSSNGVLEFVELVKIGSTNRFQMNTSYTNSGGWANSYMRNTNMPRIYNVLPDDMKDAISEVQVLSGTGANSTSGTSASSNKLFLPAECEIFSSKTYSIGASECPLGQFEYYANHNTANDRKKFDPGSTSASMWWERSPRSGYSGSFCFVYTSGNADTNSADSSYGVAPCFAI